ncbi:MAG: hypothetical protein DRN15_07855 [Thermoprotei archaeon]|nr:MAG: hypothetical protein DRN15_07855 [Thermoprotei archaeon]
MRLGCSAYSYHELLSKHHISIKDFIKEAYRLELDAVELLDIYFESTDFTTLREVKRDLLDYGLYLSSYSINNNFCLLNPFERKLQEEYVRRGIDVAVYLGAYVVRVFAGTIPEKIDKAKALDLAVDSFRRVCRYAEEMGVVLAIENHDAHGAAATPEDIKYIIEQVNSPFLRLNLDTGNFGIDEKLYDKIEQTIQYSAHVHAKVLEVDEERGDKNIDYSKVFDICRKAGYKGVISIEYEGKEDPMEAVPKIVKCMRKLLSR